ncbi:MAG: CoA-binding protein, partial [Thermoplasmata archaeon]
EAARRKGARILGPNTLGVWVPATGLNTIFVKQEASFTGGTISFITQSGSVGVVSTDNASLAGFRLGAFVGLGNKCDLDELDFLEYFGKDENTKTIMLYLESFNDGKKLMKLCSEITLRKPVVILKAGRTARGSSAASSHTGKLAGSDLVVDAAIRQSGCIRANDDEELVDFAKVLDMARPLRGNRIAVVTSAGGYGVMATDYIESDEFGVGMRMATFSEQTKAKLREVVFSFASVGNPIDLTATCDNSTYDKVLSILQEEEDVDAILCVTFFQPALLTPDLLNIVAKHAVSGRKPLVALTIGGTEALKHLQKFTELGVPAFNSTRRAIKALQALYLRGQYLIKKGVVF